MIDVVIIGAGLSGLVSAYHLSKKGYTVRVLESSPDIGGVIQTYEKNGYLLEGGPTTFTSTSETLLKLCREIGLSPVAAKPASDNRFIYHNKKLHAVPMKPLELLTSPLLSLSGKWRACLEPLQPGPKIPKGTLSKAFEETAADFIRRRLGSEVLDIFIEPFLSGIYAGDPEKLSANLVLKKLTVLEKQYKSLLLGMARSKKSARSQRKPGLSSTISQKAENQKTAYQLYNFEGGMHQLPQTLAAKLPEGSILTNCQVTSLQPLDDCYRVILENHEPIKTRAIIIATPTRAAGQLMNYLNPEIARILHTIAYAPISILHAGFKRADIVHPLDGFGFLVPKAATTPLLGCIFTSSLFPDRAPSGHVLLTCFLGGALQPETASWDDYQLRTETLAALHLIFNSPKKLEPTFMMNLNYPNAIPQLNTGHQDRIDRITATLRHHLPRVLLTGNYLAGVSLEDCTKHATETAERLSFDLALASV